MVLAESTRVEEKPSGSVKKLWRDIWKTFFVLLLPQILN